MSVQRSTTVDFMDPNNQIVDDKTCSLLGYGKLTIMDCQKRKKLDKTVVKVNQDAKGEQMVVVQFCLFRRSTNNALRTTPVVRSPKRSPILFCCNSNATIKLDKILVKMMQSYDAG